MGNSIKPPKLGSNLNLNSNKNLNPPKDLSKIGKQNVVPKIPKIKKFADSFAPPSVFFNKSENFQGPKHASLRNLWDFINKKHKKSLKNNL